MTMWIAAKTTLAGIWSLVLAFMVVSLGESLAPLTQVEQADFALLVCLIASAIFAGICWAFSLPGKEGATKPPVRFPNRPEEPLVGCPTCHTQMRLIGCADKQGETPTYLWSCEHDHHWSRQGVSPADATHPWQPCSPAKMMAVFFG